MIAANRCRIAAMVGAYSGGCPRSLTERSFPRFRPALSVRRGRECAMWGRLAVGKGFLDVLRNWVGAAMCSTCWCGTEVAAGDNAFRRAWSRPIPRALRRSGANGVFLSPCVDRSSHYIATALPKLKSQASCVVSPSADRTSPSSSTVVQKAIAAEAHRPRLCERYLRGRSTRARSAATGNDSHSPSVSMKPLLSRIVPVHGLGNLRRRSKQRLLVSYEKNDAHP